MKIAIPVESKSLDIPVNPSLGRTPYFVLYDLETERHQFLENFAVTSQGGAGIRAAQMLVDHGVMAIITYRCGDNAAQVLNAAKIEIYKAAEGTVSDHIMRFREGKLSLLTKVHPGFHHHGGTVK